MTVGCIDNEPYTRDEFKGENPSLQPSSTEEYSNIDQIYIVPVQRRAAAGHKNIHGAE